MLYEIHARPQLRAPALVTGLEGWVDAGGVGSGLAAHVGEGATPLVTFDSDLLLDYRSRRPVLDVVDGAMRDMAWPELTIRLRQAPERDVLVLTGPEPDMRWREFADAIVDLAGQFGLVQSVCIGAIGAAVPHTRPTPVLATASRADILEAADTLPSGLLRVPAAAINLVELRLAELDIPSVGFWAQVPHYVGGAYPAAMLAVLERLNRYLGVEIEAGDLRAKAEAQRAEVEAAVGSTSEARAYVEQLEAIVDRAGVPSGEDIAAEVERFLREASEGGGTNPFPGG